MVVLLAEKKKFVLYEYLVFFWKKKAFFIIIPLIFTLLGFSASYLVPKDGKYVGKATIFVGGVKLKSLTDPDNIVAQYGQDVNGKIDAYVSSDSFVKIKIYDDNEEQLTKDLENMVSKVENSLLDSYEKRHKSTSNSLITAQKKLEELTDVLKVTVNKLENGNLAIDEAKDVTSVIEWTEMEIADTEARIARLDGDLAFFEGPSVYPYKVSVVNTYKTELSIAGLILGVFATFLILMLWKYIIEARRYSNHD